jgi:hypothetical protein
LLKIVAVQHPATRATTLLEYKHWLRDALHVNIRSEHHLAKQRAPYIISNQLPKLAREAIQQLDAQLQRTLLRIPNVPRLIRDDQTNRIRFYRYSTPRGHRSIQGAPYSALPKPVIFDRSSLNCAREYLEVVRISRELLSTAKPVYAVRFDIRKAYPSLSGHHILRAYEALHRHAGIHLNSRRYQDRLKQLNHYCVSTQAYCFSNRACNRD